MSARPADGHHWAPLVCQAARLWPLQSEPLRSTSFADNTAVHRERFRLPNHHDGFVLGTGDLGEIALGWSP